MSSKFSYNKPKFMYTAAISLVLISIMAAVQIYEKKQRYEIPALEAMSEEEFNEDYVKGTIPYTNKENAGTADSNKPSNAQSTQAEIIVHIAGEVNHPSVITMAEGSRLYEAIEKAGGLTENAEQSLINLAQELADGTQYVIPKKGDEAQPNSAGNAGSPSGGTSAQGQDGKLNINAATEKEFETLNGIGPVLAARIVEYRDSIGKFRDISELKDVKGIGEVKFEGLKDNVFCK